jgi:hypothetical protein
LTHCSLREVNVMRSRTDRTPDGWAARLTRWLGFDRNPLRRGTDRVEAALRLVLIILIVLVVPAAAVAAGQWADHRGLHQSQLKQATDHLVTAVLIQDAPASGPPDPHTSVPTTWVLARWQPPGQPPRTGQLLAVAGARKGSTVRTWIDPSGAITDPPQDHRIIVGYVWLAVMATWLLSSLLLLAAVTLARGALDRRRLSAWEAEWRASGPRWSGHRS